MKKRILLFLIIALVFTGCVKQKDDVSVNEKQLQEFQNLIAQTDEPFKVKDYLDHEIQNAGLKTADALVLEYLNYMESLMYNGFPGYEKQMQSLKDYFDYDTWTIDESSIQDSDTMKVYQTFKNAGFKFIHVEGFITAIIDYHFLEAYTEMVSPEISDYSKFMILDSEEPWAIDAGIIIPLTDLADRIAMAEQYIHTYPESILKDKVIRQYNFYLRAFLGGLDNTPLVLYDTNKVDPGFVEAFDYFIATYPDLDTAVTVKTFRAELESKHFKAPYTYNESDKRMAFMKHVDELVSETTNKF